MIAAVELEDGVAARHCARDAHRAHRGLGAARHESQHLDVRHAFRDQFAELHLESSWNAEARAAPHGVVERREDNAGGVAERERAPREHVVDVFMAVDIPDPGAISPLDDERLAADSAERANWRAHTTRKERTGALHDFSGTPRHRPKLPIVPSSG